MHIELDVELISQGINPPFLLTIGYGNGHVVVQIDSPDTIENILQFVVAHRADKAACWMTMGRFASCSVTLTLSDDLIAIVIDTNVSAGSFGQSAGIYIPKERLDDIVAALRETHRRFIDKWKK